MSASSEKRELELMPHRAMFYRKIKPEKKRI